MSHERRKMVSGHFILIQVNRVWRLAYRNNEAGVSFEARGRT